MWWPGKNGKRIERIEQVQTLLLNENTELSQRTTWLDGVWKYLGERVAKMAMSQAEATAKINALVDQVAKIRGEIQALKDAAANQPNLTVELEAAVNRLTGAVQAADDDNPDATLPTV